MRIRTVCNNCNQCLILALVVEDTGLAVMGIHDTLDLVQPYSQLFNIGPYCSVIASTSHFGS